MKKPKIKFDSAQIQSLFLQHVEKLVLVAVIGVSLFLVYQGFSLPRLEQSKTPQGLKQTSQQVMQHIDNPGRWNEVRAEKEVQPDVLRRAHLDRTPADPTPYFLGMRWETPNFPKLSPRTDPTIFEPTNLVVSPVEGPLAYVKYTDVDPLIPAPSEEAESTPAPKPKPKPARPRDPMAILGGDPMGSGSGMYSSQPRRGRRNRGEPDAAGMAGAEMYGPEMVTGDSMGMGMEMGGATMGKINPESIFGYQAGNATAKETQAVVVMAVVPFEKQFEEFQNALANSLDFVPTRDSPLYLQFYVQRADVTDDPNADLSTLKWDSVGVNAAKAESANWAGTLKEVVDPVYIDRTLTQAAPPFMQREVWDLLYHPDLPLPPLAAKTTPTRPGLAPLPVKPESASGDDKPSFDVFAPQRGSGFDNGMTTPFGAGTGATPAAAPGAGMYGSASGSGMYGSDAGMGYGADGMGYGDSFGAAGAPPPKYKLVRFTDTTVEPGHKYRYRIKVLLHDPNHPSVANGYVAPSPASLAEPVRTRIKNLDANVFWLESKWSEPSPVASLPAPYQFFAGSVTQPSTTSNLVPGKPPVPASLDPVGKTLAVVWDRTKVADIPAETEVHRGSILNFVKDAQVIHPVTHQVVDLAQYAFSTNAVVADMIGGDVIPLLDKQSKKSPLTAPGELLIFDAAGRLHVQNEADDIDAFRRYLVPEAPPPPKTGTSTPMMDGDAGMYDILDAPMPGTGRGRNRGP